MQTIEMKCDCIQKGKGILGFMTKSEEWINRVISVNKDMLTGVASSYNYSYPSEIEDESLLYD